VQRSGNRIVAATGEVQFQPQRSQRMAQLVGGVGGETALMLQTELEAIDQPIDRLGERRQLDRHAFVGERGRHRAGSGGQAAGQLAQRFQSAAQAGEHHRRHQHQQGQQRQQGRRQQFAHELVAFVQRRRHLDPVLPLCIPTLEYPPAPWPVGDRMEVRVTWIEAQRGQFGTADQQLAAGIAHGDGGSMRGGVGVQRLALGQAHRAEPCRRVGHHREHAGRGAHQHLVEDLVDLVQAAPGQPAAGGTPHQHDAGHQPQHQPPVERGAHHATGPSGRLIA
jgi:hypothetical protein